MDPNGALDESPQNDELQLSKFTQLLDWMLQPPFLFQGGKLLATTELCRADWDPTGEWDISGRSEIMGKNMQKSSIRMWEDNFLKIRIWVVKPAEVRRI